MDLGPGCCPTSPQTYNLLPKKWAAKKKLQMQCVRKEELSASRSQGAHTLFLEEQSDISLNW